MIACCSALLAGRRCSQGELSISKNDKSIRIDDIYFIDKSLALSLKTLPQCGNATGTRRRDISWWNEDIAFHCTFIRNTFQTEEWSMRMRFLGAEMMIFGLYLSAAMAADPFQGKWRLDPSKTEDSNPRQVTFASITNGISLRTNQQMAFVAYYNGKDYPIDDGNTIRALRLNDHTLVSTARRKGKVLSKATITVTKDGKHASALIEGWGLEGPYRDTVLVDRIGPEPPGDAFLGTWQQIPSQTRYDPPLVYNLKVLDTRLEFSTNREHIVKARFDGKDYRRAASDATIRLKRIDDYTIEVLQKNPFDPPVTSQWQVSGKTLVVTSTGIGALGKPFKRVQYFDRIE